MRFELTTLGLVLSLGITGAVGALAAWHVSTLEQTQQLISHTHEVLETSQSLGLIAGEAARARRAFAITHDEAELSPYRGALSRLELARASLRRLTLDNDAQVRRVDQLDAVLGRRVAQLDSAVADARTHPFDAAREAELIDAGLPLTKELAALCAQLEGEERQLLAQRQAAAFARSSLVKTTLLAGFGASSALLILAFGFLRRELIERSRSEEQLAERENRLAITLASIGDAVMATDARGRVTHLNPVAQALTGWPIAEARGAHHKEVFRIVDEKTLEPAQDVVARVLTERTRVELSNHTALVARDGTRRPVADSAAPILDERGKLQGAVLVFRDVSATRHIEERFRSLVEAAPDAILIAGQDGLIQVANEQATALFGYQAEELVGQPIEKLIPAGLREKHVRHRQDYHAAPVARAMGTGLSLLAQRKDGSSCPVEISLSPLQTPTGTQVIAAVRDVTQRRELERFRDEYVGYISHDLKNPLSVIALQARLLTRLQAGGASPDEEHAVRVIAESASFIDQLVRELLEMAYVESDHLELHPEPLELSTFLTALLERAVVTERARVKLELGGEATVLADASRLERVVVNFVQNAIKYSPPGSPIVVRLEEQGAHARVSVTDRGPGIPESERQEVFGKYRRTASARGKEGLGLGLYISSKIVEAHHGTIGVDAAKEGGASFYLTLPRIEPVAQAKRAEPPQGPAPAHARTKVLLVDDEVNAIKALTVLLADEGLEVASATTGEKALTLAALDRPDVVVLDVQMPEMSGLTLLELLRERHPGLPAVIMSGHLEQHAGIAEARQSTGAAYVSKPVDVDELLRTIDRMVRGP